MSTTNYRQFMLIAPDRATWVWLADDPRLVPGVSITLLDHPNPEIIWEVSIRSGAVVDVKPKGTWQVGAMA